MYGVEIIPNLGFSWISLVPLGSLPEENERDGTDGKLRNRNGMRSRPGVEGREAAEQDDRIDPNRLDLMIAQ